MLLQITHTTTYHYTPQVNSAQHMAHLLPRTTPSQTVHRSELTVDPAPATRRDAMDVYGNARTFFSIPGAHAQLQLQAQSWVQTQPTALNEHALANWRAASPAWEKVREHFRYHAGAQWDAATEFSFASPHVQAHAEFANYARASFTPQRPLLDAAVDLMQRIHRDFEYASQSTDVHTPALQALSQRKGVCQDFAHIWLSCMRTLGLAARYVSGYVLTEPPAGQPRLIGSDASHAWGSLYVPQSEGTGQWFDLDPTNNRWGLNTPGEDYVCLAWGRDVSDVSPLRGVIHGGASHSLEGGVTVMPLDEKPSAALKSACPQA